MACDSHRRRGSWHHGRCVLRCRWLKPMLTSGDVVRTPGVKWGGLAGIVLIGLPAVFHFISLRGDSPGRVGGIVAGALITVVFIRFAKQCLRVRPTGIDVQNWYKREFHQYSEIRRFVLR